MKVFFIDAESFCSLDFIDALSRYRHNGNKTEIYKFSLPNDGKWNDPEREAEMEKCIKAETPDFAFSFNYYPLVSKVCQKTGLKYISWVYDNPQVALYSYTLINSCNEVFLFDTDIYDSFALQGIKTVHYMPLAASVKRLDGMITNKELQSRYSAEISFVGSLYTEEHNFYDRMIPGLDDYTRGYLEGLMRSQMQIQGYNFIESSLNDKLISSMYTALPLEPQKGGVETKKYLYADYVINRKITALERLELLKKIAEHHPVDIYTKDETVTASGIRNHGIAKYYDEMPYIFKSSAINLNITLRSIKKGIPLRCFDIMACGGFLISNFQEDFLRYFEPDKDFVFYDSKRDLLEKIDYYLLHDSERKEISQNAYKKIKKDHTFDIRIEQILRESGIK